MFLFSWGWGGLTHNIGMTEASNNSKIFHFHSIYKTGKFSVRPTRSELFGTSYYCSALKYMRFLKNC